MADLEILGHLILDWVDKKPDLDVLTFVDIDQNGNFVEETRTYRQLWENGQRLAAWLKGQGMQKGDAFGIVMANHPEFVDLMVASSILGTVFVPIDPRTRGDKLRYMLDFAECKGAVVADYASDNVEAAWGDRKDLWKLYLGTAPSTCQRCEDVLSAPIPNPVLEVASTDSSAPMQLLYTSGTTGDPKAILTAHSRFAVGKSIAGILGLTEEDRPYTGLSLTHANAQIITLGSALALGLRGVVSRKFTKSRLWDLARQYGCTWFNLLGGMTTAIYAEPPKSNDGDNPVRIILSAGMPAAIWEDFSDRFDTQLCEFYGSAEGGLTFNPPGAGPVGSCGKAVATMEICTFDENGDVCAPGQAGEICFRNIDGTVPVVKYFKNLEASAKKTAGGWLRMGDIGHLDENGWLFFHYRDGGGIRRNGDFINPGFVEKGLSQIDCIDDVFVYGVPAANGAPGEKDVVAAIVVGEQFSAQKVFDFCRDQLEPNFVPSYLQVVDEIPKTASEKPLERFLLEDIQAAGDNIFTANGLAGS